MLGACIMLHLLTSGFGRFCCKSLFALVIKNFPGFRRDFRVKMWGTSSPDDKLADDPGNAIEGTRISGRRLDRLMAGKHHRTISDFCNNIGTDRLYPDVRDHGEYWG